MSDLVIEVKDLRKVYRTPFQARRVTALQGISFAVKRGEVFGFLGPNGAGKTTTIRILMGLISPTAGIANIFGHRVPSRAARMRLGFLPEQPYFYEYLRVPEMLDLTGRLFGMDRRARRSRGDALIERVGLAHARDIPLKKFSKGMLQRAGIAQALMNDPDLVVFDEPLSGLDPKGRKEVLDIISGLREQGKTVFFSSHILTDVELVSDRVAIMAAGQVRETGALSTLVGRTLQSTELRVRLPQGAAPEIAAALAESALASRKPGGEEDRELTITLPPEVDVDERLARARELGAKVIAVIPHYESLEELFIRHTLPDKEAR